MSEPTETQISRAAYKWCGEKERETFYDDILYFKNNWRAFPGLKAYVDREVAETRTKPLGQMSGAELQQVYPRE